jgi:hypothetical protein
MSTACCSANGLGTVWKQGPTRVFKKFKKNIWLKNNFFNVFAAF